MTISEDDFMSEYRPIQVANEGEFAHQTYDEALQFAHDKGLGDSHIWTICESDDSESLFAIAGYHHVNSSGCVVTERPWETGMEQAMWFDEEDFDLDLDEGPSPE